MSQKPEPPLGRTLDVDFPELKPYLSPGMDVLDVGCGTGTITLGVAEFVKLGNVVGVEPLKDRVDTAKNWATANPHVTNISFQVGDSHHLEFPDNTFDVVYSNTVLHFFRDPVMGLQEQKRVTKNGGWVIAAGVRDMHTTYPYYPNWEKVYDTFRRYWIKRVEEYHASGLDPVTFYETRHKIDPSYIFYYDMQAGRKCAEWFHQAGLTDIQLMVQTRRIKYHGHKNMKPHVCDFLVLEAGEYEGERIVQQGWQSDHQRMIDLGLLDDETLKRAIEEARAFYNHPGAFQFWLEIFAVGRVP